MDEIGDHKYLHTFKDRKSVCVCMHACMHSECETKEQIEGV